MKNSRLFIVFSLLLISTLITSCSAVAGIFKAGMGVGIFIVVLIIIVIAAFVMKSGKK